MSLFNDKEGWLCLGSLGSVLSPYWEALVLSQLGLLFSISLFAPLFLSVQCAPSVESTKICSFSFQLLKNFFQQEEAND